MAEAPNEMEVSANLTKEERRALHQQRLAAQPGKPKPKEKTVLTKAQRKAQHAQRVAAAAAKKAGGNVEPTTNVEPHTETDENTSASATMKPPPPDEKQVSSSTKKDSSYSPASPRSAAILLFVPHLPIPPKLSDVIDTGPNLRPLTVDASLLPPAAVRLGYHYVTGTLRGGNARCRAMLTVLRNAVVPASTSREELSRAFQICFQFWTACRPHAVSMGNAFTFIKAAIATLDRDMEYDVVQSHVTELLQTYEQERIEYAVKAICDTACQKLQPRHVVTYGYSEAVMTVLLEAEQVVVVDSPPLYEGRRTLRELQRAGISCQYIDMEALTYVLSDVAPDTKVLMGAAALQTDGSVTGRIGTAVVALAAKQAGIPVLVCAETYKIAASRGVPLESLTHNELYRDGDDDEKFQLLYDLTPARWISGIVTELGLVPPTSVAVLLREMNPHELKGGGMR